MISHTTMQAFKKTAKGIKEIGKELNVNSVLKAVCGEWAIRSGYMLNWWMWLHKKPVERNNRKDYAKIFDIQSEIAQQIANKLAVKVSEAEKNVLNKTNGQPAGL